MTECRWIFIGGLCVCAVSFGQDSAVNIVRNASFEIGDAKPSDWESFAPNGATLTRDPACAHSGSASARIEVRAEGAKEYPAFKYALRDVKAGEVYEGKVWARTKDMTWAWGAYVVLEFMEGEKRIDFAQGEFTGTGTTDWMELSVAGRVPANTDCVRLALVTHGEGVAWFDDATLYKIKGPDTFQGSRIQLKVNPERVLCQNFLGFGAQGDCFLSCAQNRERGVKPHDIEFVFQRVEAMRPHIIRTFFNYAWWEPEEGRPTPDSEFMRDYVAWVRFLQSIGTSVLLTPWGDNFAYAKWMIPGYDKYPPQTEGSSTSSAPKLPPRDQWPAMTRSLADLVAFLRNSQGLTNVKYLCLMNEPDNDGARPVQPADFAEIYKMLDQVLRDKGVRNDVMLLGPDESGGPLTGAGAWYRNTVPQLIDVFDGLSCHTYQHRDVSLLAPWIQRRMETLKQLGKVKPFLITEFGYGGGTFTNPANSAYEYGLFLPDFAIAALREGASAALMWCLFDTYYPSENRRAEQKQEYGLWRYLDEGWRPRPGYYSWSLMNRYTIPGSRVVAVELGELAESLRALALIAPGGELTIPMVNRYDRPIEAELLPALDHEVCLRRYAYTRESVPTSSGAPLGASDVIRVLPGKPITTTLPAESFVLLTSVN